MMTDLIVVFGLCHINHVSIRQNVLLLKNDSYQIPLQVLRICMESGRGRLQLPLRFMNRANKTKPETFLVLPCWTSF